MNRKGFSIAVLIAAVVVVTAVVVVNRNSVEPVSAVETSESQGEESTSIEGEKFVQETTAEKKEKAGATVGDSSEKMQQGAPGKQETEMASVPGNADAQAETKTVILAAKEASADSAHEAGGSSTGPELAEAELPAETAFPDDWDWKTFPTQAPKKENSTTSPADGGESSGKDNTEKSGESESSTTEGEPEGQSAEESSKSEEKESTEEDVTEKSGEDSSTEQGEPEEQSSEDTESETETSTLSPEEQASIVESATAPIELPPIFFN